jgi:maltokinase
MVGWYGYTGELMDATLGVMQPFIDGARDGWALALDALVGEDESFLERLGSLGSVTGRMHTVLASDTGDPAFAPEEPTEEMLSLLSATLDEQIERVFDDLPVDEPAIAPIAGRGEEVRDHLQSLSHVGVGGRLIRIHGDYHLGQTLWGRGDWVVLDFEGEPGRPLIERRRKRSPLRDVAGMLRSFSYAASALPLLRGAQAAAGWEEEARERFLAGYMGEIDLGILPAGSAAVAKLLAIFELERAIYELRYELDNRPDWITIPVAGISRLLETD